MPAADHNENSIANLEREANALCELVVVSSDGRYRHGANPGPWGFMPFGQRWEHPESIPYLNSPSRHGFAASLGRTSAIAEGSQRSQGILTGVAQESAGIPEEQRESRSVLRTVQ